MKRSATAGPLRIALFAYPDVQALDLSGPLEMFARATRLLRDEGRAHPGYSLTVVGTKAGPLVASSGFRFLPDVTFRALRGEVDTLLVVGGRGMDALLDDRAVLDWLRQMAGRVRRLGSVCTGAFLLAEAGLLDGRTATTHWSRAKDLALRYPRVRVEEDRIWARDGNLYTSAGVSAGMDLALALIEEDLGSEVALAVKARESLEVSGVRTRVVSMPSFELFGAQDAAYRERVLPRSVTARLAIEAAAPARSGSSRPAA